MKSMETIVEIKNLYYKILENISLEIIKKRNIVIYGKNGSGKSLLGRILAKDIKVDNIWFKQKLFIEYVSLEKVESLIENEKREDESDITDIIDYGTTVKEYLEKQLFVDNLEQNKGIIEYLKEFELLNKLGTGIRYISTGELRKLLIVEILIKNPDIIILDSIYEGLDVDSKLKIKKYVDRLLKSNSTVVYITNIIDEVSDSVQYYDDIIILEKGKIKERLDFNKSVYNRLKKEENGKKIMLNSLSQLYENSNRCDKEKLVYIKNLKIEYNGRKIINGLNFEIKKGEHWKISGPNGCGKTTLLSVINADHPQSYNNSVELFGYKRGSGESIWDIKKYIGFLSVEFQREYTISGSVLSVIVSGFYDTIGLYNSVSKHYLQIAESWLNLLDLSLWKSRSFKSLSYGEQRVVLIVRALIKNPQLLILDEPCQGLDQSNVDLVLDIVEKICNSTDIQLIYVNHNQEQKIDFINRELLFVKNGKGDYDYKIKIY